MIDGCPICLDNLIIFIKLQCGHDFHLNCINKILNNLCPICRAVFKIEDSTKITTNRLDFSIDFIIKNSNNDWSELILNKYNDDLINYFELTSIYPIEIIVNNKNLPWNWHIITERLKIKFIIENKYFDFNWYSITKDINNKFIIENKYLPFNWYLISNKLPIAFIIENKNFDWNWHLITERLPIKFIKQNIYLKWDKKKIKKMGIIFPKFIYYIFN